VHFVAIVGAVTAVAELLLPTEGLVGFVSRALVLAALPLALVLTRFFRPGELRAARGLLSRGRGTPSEAPAAG
jgi:hypothetical protein